MIQALLLAAALSDPCAGVNRQIEQTYGFRPSQLNQAAQKTKSEQMDVIWSEVRKDPALVPCLKAALKRRTDDTWFQFDASQLLVSLDSSPDAKATLLDALRRVPFDDVDLRTWVELASSLGAEGFDTSDLGKRWLAYPKAEYFLPEHGAYHVDRANGAMFIFGALDERYATPALVALSKSATGEQKEIAVSLLMSQATPEALRALPEISVAGLSEGIVRSRDALLHGPDLIQPRRPPRTSRDEFLAAFSAFLAGDEEPFQHLVEKVPDGERDLVAVAKPEDVELLRKVRRRFISGSTQHAIEYYNQFAQILMTLVWTPRQRHESQ